MPETALVQFTRVQDEAEPPVDQVCLTIIQEPNVHIRVALLLAEFADTITTGRKIEAKVKRWHVGATDSHV